MDPNWQNRTMWTGDNLDIMRGMEGKRLKHQDLVAVLKHWEGSMSSEGQRKELYRRFRERLSTRPIFTRKTVSYQGNRGVPGFRWMKYKEGFSKLLIDSLLDEHDADSVLDPFAGIGTVPIVASRRGISATGIEIMPVGVAVGRGITYASNGVSPSAFERASHDIAKYLSEPGQIPSNFRFPHVAITQQAFPQETERAISKARQFIANCEDDSVRALLDLACMTVLEEVSYTRKDGQYLRWDYRSGRALRSRVDKGPVPPFGNALNARFSQMTEDMGVLKDLYGEASPELLTGSCLEMLRQMPASCFDMVITSPPYANRYDYTRTYALELAWMGFDQDGFSDLRQQMLSATVENRAKIEWLRDIYGDNPQLLNAAVKMYEDQGAVHEVLSNLKDCMTELGNRHVIRLIEGYCLEMALVVTELGRVVKRGGTVIMVNDNVQYHGQELPVDFILSDFAEQSGFVCTNIWTLPRGKRQLKSTNGAIRQTGDQKMRL